MTGTMTGLFRPTINLGNSIIGVSILAMPWCFSECGIVLGVTLLVLSGLMTVWSCKMLVRAAHMKSKYSYETVAQTVFGKQGKLLIEICIIGLNIGVCVGFFVIIGDLTPPIVAQATGLNWSPGFLRVCILVTLAVCVALPLSLLRNVDNLSSISIGSLTFYSTLIIQLAVLAVTNLSNSELWDNIYLWKWEGILKCLPIFCLAFACHPQMFVIYSALADPTIRKMSTVIEGAVLMVGSGYCMVAIFGYITFCVDGVKGDVLSNFPLNLLSQITRFGFGLSVVVSFPLIVFPCRGSINSLLFSKGSMELNVSEPIPKKRFTVITMSVIALTLVIAILIPRVETVLALTGATMGSITSFIYPSALFLQVVGTKSEFSNRAKVLLSLGFCLMILSTVVTIGLQSQGDDGEISPSKYINRPQKGSKQIPFIGGGQKFVDLPPAVVEGKEAIDPGGGGIEGDDKGEEGDGVNGEEAEGGQLGGDELEDGDEMEGKDNHEEIKKELVEVKEQLEQVIEENKNLREKQEVIDMKLAIGEEKHLKLEEAFEKHQKVEVEQPEDVLPAKLEGKAPVDKVEVEANFEVEEKVDNVPKLEVEERAPADNVPKLEVEERAPADNVPKLEVEERAPADNVPKLEVEERAPADNVPKLEVEERAPADNVPKLEVEERAPADNVPKLEVEERAPAELGDNLPKTEGEQPIVILEAREAGERHQALDDGDQQVADGANLVDKHGEEKLQGDQEDQQLPLLKEEEESEPIFQAPAENHGDLQPPDGENRDSESKHMVETDEQVEEDFGARDDQPAVIQANLEPARSHSDVQEERRKARDLKHVRTR